MNSIVEESTVTCFPSFVLKVPLHNMASLRDVHIYKLFQVDGDAYEANCDELGGGDTGEGRGGAAQPQDGGSSRQTKVSSLCYSRRVTRCCRKKRQSPTLILFLTYDPPPRTNFVKIQITPPARSHTQFHPHTCNTNNRVMAPQTNYSNRLTIEIKTIKKQTNTNTNTYTQIHTQIRRNIVYKEKELIIPLYKTIVRPHLEYCIQAWRPYRKKDIDMLERVQRRATKMIPKLRNISYEMRLKECGLTTLETRRLRGDQIEVFKILNGYENIDRNIFFTVKEERRTRGHGITLAKKQCRLDIRKFSFSQRTVNEWNRLSADCVGASSVNIFKNKIDIYLRRAGYT